VQLWNDTVRGFHERVVELKSKPTAEAYVYAVRLWEQFLVEEGVTSLSSARISLLDDFVRYLMKRGAAHSTIASRMTGVKAWLDYLRLRGYAVPAFVEPGLPKVVQKEPVVLTMDELATFFGLVAENVLEPSRTAMLLMPLCGLRSEEITRLKLTDISQLDGWVIFSFTGKGAKPRQVPLLRQGNAILRSYLTGWRASYKHPSPWLFPGHKLDTPMGTRTVRRWAGKIAEETGIDALSPHVLRKTYTTMLDAMGVSPLMTAQLVGHTHLRTTKNHYIHHDIGTLTGSLSRVRVSGIP